VAQHAFWIIVDGTTPTSFRSRQREDLLPTLTQLQRTQPQVSLMWFERGRLWPSPTEAREALGVQRKTRPGRGRDWRPGGEHADPRAKYMKTRDEKRARFKSRLGRDRSEAPPASSEPPADGESQAPKPSRPPYRRPDSRPVSRPEGRSDDRPTGRPAGRSDSRPSGRPDRPEWRKPSGDRPFSDRPPRPRPPGGSGYGGSGGYGKDRPAGGSYPRPDSRGPESRGPGSRPSSRPPDSRGPGSRPPDSRGPGSRGPGYGGGGKWRNRERDKPAPRRDGPPRESSEKPKAPKGFGDRPWRPKKPWRPTKPKGGGGSGSR
jgi:hypothetical protein